MVTPLLRELAGPFRPFIPFGYARDVSDAWERARRQATENGRAEELHSARDDYQALLLAHLKILDGWLMLLRRFPREYPPGFAEDFTSIRDRYDDVVAVVLTHGHEDHIGAVPYLLKERGDIPLIGSQLTLALIEAKFGEE